MSNDKEIFFHNFCFCIIKLTSDKKWIWCCYETNADLWLSATLAICAVCTWPSSSYTTNQTDLIILTTSIRCLLLISRCHCTSIQFTQRCITDKELPIRAYIRTGCLLCWSWLGWSRLYWSFDTRNAWCRSISACSIAIVRCSVPNSNVGEKTKNGWHCGRTIIRCIWTGWRCWHCWSEWQVTNSISICPEQMLKLTNIIGIQLTRIIRNMLYRNSTLSNFIQ